MTGPHPRLLFAAVWVLFWILMNVTAVQDYVRDGGSDYWKPVLWESSSALVITLLVAAQLAGTRGARPLLATPLRWFAVQLRWLPLYWIVFAPLAFGLRHAVYGLAGETYTHEPWPGVLLYEGVKMTVFFGLFVLIQFGMLSYQAMQQERLRAEESRTQLRQAQLQQLTQQMQPHFLFNALNTVSSLMHTDVARADALLMQLADVLRAALDAGERQQTPLSAELRLLRAYAQLMAARFDDRVTLAWDIGDGIDDCIVPVMSLQPLLENIFKHTVEKRRQTTAIRIAAARDGHRLRIVLEDDSGTLGAESCAGIGLSNLRVRLAALYGADAALRLTQLEPAGVRAELTLPC